MKRTLIAAGGALATAAALVVLATPASAVPAYCNLSLADASRSLGIDTWGVYSGQREADACESDHGTAHDKYDKYDKYDDGNNWDQGNTWDSGNSWGNGGWDNGNWGGSNWGNQGHGHGYTTNWASPGNWGNRGWGLRGGWGSRGYGWPASPYRF
ncbi:hypothetical protein [Nonomuraea gerenzanensis]|uniref:ATP-dependent RNA helicase A n=1 Tax=Nonomuraea gerenzanensis TaxID=93944 RepID=A0A1M4EID8_9ACTN|nr:hypothetical protein [Nonomuraea gerenzanensis]UBU10191.1 hypothetical protein LCN96_38375 [Nonomuraea gerenzanensis]SBO98566.1 ATP-dependent RNA helicase A [Nonomuraea gerenzanensis]